MADANKSNLFHQMEEVEKNKSGAGEGEDIDSILNYLENKNKKKDVPKLPVINNTREKFYKAQEKKEVLRESKTELKHGEFMNYGRDDWKNIRANPAMFDEKEKNSRNGDSSYKKKYHSNVNGVGSLNHLAPGSKKESLPPNKFSYSFQPAAVPSFLPSAKGMKNNAGLGLAYVPLPKPNSLLKK